MTTNAELKRLAEGAEVTLDPSEALKPVYTFLAAANPARIIALVDEVERLRGALAWYGEQARLARLIHGEGDAGRNALAADGGTRARQALTTGEGE